ncbi:MAG TPA: low affinity iron permease family protein [Sphingomonas sp.]|nr:low affinity iron permease family protein [Sphingomonas sp.]
MEKFFTHAASKVAAFAGRAGAFALAVLFIIIWGASGPLFHFSDTWQLVVNTATTIVTFLMVFLIQNSQNRDSASMQAKLDEVIRVLKEARNNFIGLEHMSDDEIEKVRSKIEEECAEEVEEETVAAAAVSAAGRKGAPSADRGSAPAASDALPVRPGTPEEIPAVPARTG